MPQSAPSPSRVGHANSPAEMSKRGWRDVLRRSAKALAAQHLSLAAAGIAFYAVWALFPAIAVLVVLAALLLGKGHVLWLLSQVKLDLPEAFNVIVVSQLDAIAQRSRGLSITTIVGALAFSLWSGMRGVHGLMTALNLVYAEKERRTFWERHLLALLLCVGAGLFMLIAVLLVVGLAGQGLPVPEGGWDPLALWRWPVLVLALVLSLSVVYRYAPCRELPKWRWVTWGAATSATIWVAGSFVLSYYAAHFGHLNPLLGSLASVMIFLFWCYVTVLAVLFGAEINAELERHTVVDTSADASSAPPLRRLKS